MRDPRAYTPAHLAEKILSLRSAIEGERKQVTVLFADVQGSTDLAESVDAEACHHIMDRFFAIGAVPYAREVARALATLEAHIDAEVPA